MADARGAALAGGDPCAGPASGRPGQLQARRGEGAGAGAFRPCFRAPDPEAESPSVTGAEDRRWSYHAARRPAVIDTANRGQVDEGS
jgi:hypothetical protein